MDILLLVRLAHHFGGAYSADMIFSYFKFQIDRSDFDKRLKLLLESGQLFEQNNFIYDQKQNKLADEMRNKRKFSFALFKNYQGFLKIIWLLPWIQFIGLTGSNSFENCDETDDLDLFIVTSPNRIWITNFVIFVLKSMIGKRLFINDNFYIESTGLSIYHKSYYSAIQLLQMIPVSNNRFVRQLIEQNEWITKELPNSGLKMNLKSDYVLFSKDKNNRNWFKPLDWLNRFLYKLYRRKKTREGLTISGDTIFIRENYAKLHRYQFHTDYDRFFVSEKEQLNS